MAYAQPAYAQPAYAQPAYAQPAYAQPAYPEQAPFTPPPPVPEPAPAPEPEPFLAPEPYPDIEADAAARAEAALMAEEEEAAADTGDIAGEAAIEDSLSTEQLDEMFGEDSEGGAFDSMTNPTVDTDDDAGPPPEGEPVLDDIPDPDPIPGVFSAADDDDDMDKAVKKGGKGKIIGIAAAVFIIALGAGLFFGRPYIIELYPPAKDIYAMISLGGKELGEGLDIRNVKSVREVENGVDVLVVRGEIANVTDKEHMVPMIRVVLFDSAGEEIQSALAAPLKNRLQGGAMIAFGAKLPEPSALARRLEVTFSEAKKKAQ
ncbi:MAG: FxLYD domain-containing protein [Proteobacteria bacterium]|nr:FxLYD domain-containing protein [Pseudomonadota bacterium]